LIDQESVRVLVDDDEVVRELDALGAPELVRGGIDPQTQHETLRRPALLKERLMLDKATSAKHRCMKWSYLDFFVDDQRLTGRILSGQRNALAPA
jgi:hypothetical protein